MKTTLWDLEEERCGIVDSKALLNNIYIYKYTQSSTQSL